MTISIVTLLALVGKLAKRKLLLELPPEGAVVGDQLPTHLAESLPRSNRAVCLDPDHDFRYVRVGDYNQEMSALTA